MVAVTILPWADFRRRWRWQQGEHVTLVGHTGSGKSTLALSLLAPRPHSVVLATKPKDATLDQLVAAGWRRSRRWPPPPKSSQVILWPRTTGSDPDELYGQQAGMFRKALGDIYRSGGWTVYADELRYMTDQLRLAKHFELLWLQGRSLRISLMTATQRPYHVPLEAWSQATHIFLWRESDKRNLDRLVEIGGVDTSIVRATVPRLGLYSTLYVNTRTGGMAVTRPPAGLALRRST